jgi:hypothetical protein
VPLFIIAEKFRINELCNKIMDAVQDGDFKHSLGPMQGEIERVFGSTNEGNKWRKYCVLMIIRLGVLIQDGVDEDRKELLEEMPQFLKSYPDFGEDFTKLYLEYAYRFQDRKLPESRQRTGTQSFGQCVLHTHAKNEVCHLGQAKAHN